MMRVLAILLVCSQAVVQAADAVDMTVEPGHRVGAITAWSSLSVLEGIFGRAGVRAGKVTVERGETVDGAFLLETTDHAMEVLWEPDAVGRRVAVVRLSGKGWKLGNGLALGMSLAEVEKLNGKPFKVHGFSGEDGGEAVIAEGELAKGLSLRFKPTESPYGKEISGTDKLVPSTDSALKAAGLVLAELRIVLTPER